jgi:DHA1 family inner membrane transport protein
MTRTRERTLLILLAAVQFTHVLDFMVMLPLGPQLMRDLDIGPKGFGFLVSVYSLASGIVGFIATGFIDRYERRKLLLITYVGFIVGTFACAVSHTLASLTIARAICGAFGGICGSIVMTTAADIVPPERRAAGLGIVTTSFSFAAAGGVPLGLLLANKFNWEAPFWLIGVLSLINCGLIYRLLPVMRDHIHPGHRIGIKPLLEILTDSNALIALLFFGMLVFAHFTIIPMLAPHLTGNTGLDEKHLFLIYLVGGISSIVTTPIIGRLADKHGRVRIFGWLMCVAACVTIGITHSGRIPLVVNLLLASAFFIFASGRFIPAQAISSMAVQPRRRGAFMSLTSCARDLMAGLTATIGGWIVSTGSNGAIIGYDRLGWIAVAAGFLSLWLATRVKTVEPPRSVPEKAVA